LLYAADVTSAGFCRELARAEPLAGTGTDAVLRWVLLEDAGPWGPKPPKDSELPPRVIEWLQARDAEPHTRVQLIRRPGSSRGSRRKLILAHAAAQAEQRQLVELEVELDELPGLELEALWASAPACPTLADLWLVCTHGTRDRCCAKWGMPTFAALNQLDPDRVWQSSHLGGHRFAPTMLTLPGGLLWGRLDNARLPELRAALMAGRIEALEHLRGRCCHPRVVQAAECLLRTRDSIIEDAELEYLGCEPGEAGHERIGFRRSRTGAIVEIVLARAELEVSTPPSCGDEPEPRTTFRLLV
jgi:hypothetical protein